MSSVITPIRYDEAGLHLLDQRKLPHQEIFVLCQNEQDVYWAIKNMITRGAPLIGFTGAYGLVLYFKNLLKNGISQFQVSDLQQVSSYLISARPTAVNLAYEINTLVKKLTSPQLLSAQVLSAAEAFDISLTYVQGEYQLLAKNNFLMHQSAEKFLAQMIPHKKQYSLMTHCNTGTLACGPAGTALGVITYLASQNKIKHVYVDETRPYLQGSRLTAYELSKHKIPYSVVVEGASSFLMNQKLVDAIFVGADRIALNGDTANKIGTSALAIVAHYYQVPFFVVAPLSTVDPQSESGVTFEIEMRDPMEILVSQYGSPTQSLISPINAKALNPSFDMTPQQVITGIMTELGVMEKPFYPKLKNHFNRDIDGSHLK